MTAAPATQDRELALVELGRLTPHPHNPRGPITRESLAELVDSIKAQGILQPLLVRPLGDSYQVVAGHRRLAAAKLAGLKAALVIVRPMDDAAVLEAQLAENAGREDLNPLQQAEAYARYLKATGATQEQLGKRLGLTQGTVSAALSLLDLPPAGRKLVEQGILTPAHGRELGRLLNHPREMSRVLAWLGNRSYGGPVASSRTVRGWVDAELKRLDEADQERMRAAAEAVAKAKAKAEGKRRPAEKRSAAEVKRTAAAGLASRISRQRHLEIAVRATAIAKEAIALGRRWKVPAGALVFTAHTCDAGRALAVSWSQKDLTYDTLATLQVALVGRLPGKWRRHGSAGMRLEAQDALDATAAQAWLGFWAWLLTRTRGLEAQLEAAAKRRLAAAAKVKARPKSSR